MAHVPLVFSCFFFFVSILKHVFIAVPADFVFDQHDSIFIRLAFFKHGLLIYFNVQLCHHKNIQFN